jgi:hypothetical protein
MATPGTKFARKQEDAIAALLTHRNVEEAAHAAGMGFRTLCRWLTEPEFQTAYRQARREAFSQSIARLQQASSAAVSTLLKVIVDANSPASSKVRAADCILNHATRGIELEDLEARVNQLERSLQASNTPAGD